MSKKGIESIIEEIRKLTPNHPDYINEKIIEQNKTYTQKQWEFSMKRSQGIEHLRKKSTRLKRREETIISSLNDLDKILEEESLLIYKKDWKKLNKRLKINRLMNYYGKLYNEILIVFDKFNNKDIEYDKSLGEIKNITVKNIFENAE